MWFTIACAVIFPTVALDNGVGITPPMGFNPWNCFGIGASGTCKLPLPWHVPGPYKSCHSFNESVILDVAKAIANSPLKGAGYEYVNLDCGYSTGFRDNNGKLTVNTTRYPHGMVWLGKQIHSLGLKFGMYSDAGSAQCCSRFYGKGVNDGSAGYEKQDAETFASWGVDYLKHDSCAEVSSSYHRMRDALNATGRMIYYSIHSGPEFFNTTVANCWRTTSDINNTWESIVDKARRTDAVADRAGPGGFNDPDMLEVGNLFGDLGDAESRSHFSMWAAMKAPLLIGTDVTNMSKATLTTLTNKDVIAVNQDPLGIQAKLVPSAPSDLLVWAGPLSGDCHVLLAVNMKETPIDITVDLSWAASGAVQVKELWSGKSFGTRRGTMHFKAVGGHDNVMLVLEAGMNEDIEALV